MCIRNLHAARQGRNPPELSEIIKIFDIIDYDFNIEIKTFSKLRHSILGHQN